MSIRRAPRPDGRFLIVRNDVCRDERLSYRALGLLVSMLSFPDNWTFATERLAKGDGREGEKAVRTALKELERTGYLVRRRLKTDSGRFAWEHVLYDTPRDALPASSENPPGVLPEDARGVTPDDAASSQVSDITAGQTIRQECTDGKPPGGNRPSIEDGHEDHQEKKDVQSSPAADAAARKSKIDQKRLDDIALLRDVIGADSVVQHGIRYSVKAVYDAVYKRTAAQWPGAWARAIDEAEYTGYESFMDYLAVKWSIEPDDAAA